MILMIFIHERLWQVRPSEVVVLAVEHLFCRSSLVVVQYDFLVGHVPVVGQYAAVCILAVEEVNLLALLLTLPLYDETAVLHVLETLEGEGLYVIALEADFHGGPTRLPLDFLGHTCPPQGTGGRNQRRMLRPP